MKRNLYRHDDLRRMLAPRSIAIVGATEKAGAFSSRTVANLAGFEGRVHLVNPRYQRIGDQPCHPSLDALPEVPDCVVVAVPQDAVLDAIEEAGRVGAGGAIVYASGFAETGIAEQVALQQRLADTAMSAGVRVLGPNCIGAINNHLHAALTFQVGYTALAPRAGQVGLVSQSGALSYALLEGARHGQGYSHVLASGNSCDVDVLDLAAFLVDDPTCKAVACLLEGFSDLHRVRQLAELSASAGKPVIIYKTAIADSSAEVARSHTGSLAGSHDAFLAAMREHNFVVVESLAELAEAADFFAKTNAPQSDGVAVMATSGGAAVIAADSAARYQVPLPPAGPEAQAILDANIPDFGSSRNPCDLTAQVLNSPQSFVSCVRAILDDPGYGILILPQVTAEPGLAVKRYEAIASLAETSTKPICIPWLSEWLESEAAVCYARDPRITFFRSMDRCFKTIGLWHQWHAARSRPKADPAMPSTADAAARARALLQQQPEVVTERVAKQIVASYGIPTVQELSAQDADSAVAAAQQLGFPVVLKLDSPDAAHKTELGLVRVGLRNAEEVASACRDMLDKARDLTFGAFLVQSMARGPFELMLGMKRDPVFGPLVMVGLGGVFVEIFGDVASALAPVTNEGARAMLTRLKAHRLLAGYRGQPGVDLDALAAMVVRFSHLCHDLRDDLVEIDVNPVIAGPDAMVAVDALLVRRADPTPARPE